MVQGEFIDNELELKNKFNKFSIKYKIWFKKISFLKIDVQSLVSLN